MEVAAAARGDVLRGDDADDCTSRDVLMCSHTSRKSMTAHLPSAPSSKSTARTHSQRVRQHRHTAQTRRTAIHPRTAQKNVEVALQFLRAPAAKGVCEVAPPRLRGQLWQLDVGQHDLLEHLVELCKLREPASTTSIDGRRTTRAAGVVARTHLSSQRLDTHRRRIVHQRMTLSASLHTICITY
jgi:hypothetical protein